MKTKPKLRTPKAHEQANAKTEGRIASEVAAAVLRVCPDADFCQVIVMRPGRFFPLSPIMAIGSNCRVVPAGHKEAPPQSCVAGSEAPPPPAEFRRERKALDAILNRPASNGVRGRNAAKP